MDHWRVIDLTSFGGDLRYRRGQLVVCPEQGAESVVPLADVMTVLVGLGVRIDSSVLHQLAAFDVIVLMCDWNGVPSGGMYGWGNHTRIGARQHAQASMSLPRRKNAWGQIIRAKISGQAANLRQLDRRNSGHLVDMVKDVRSGDPSNVEGRAARYYWARLFEGDKFARVPGGRAGRNGLLDYGYTVLRGHGIRAVMAAGLSSTIGVFHHNRSNAFNLVDDLIEPFRPAIDWVVASMPSGTSVDDPGVRHALVSASSQVFQTNGLSVAATVTDLAQQMGLYTEGQVAKLTVPSWSGPQNPTRMDAP
jgi:CRISPR-associated protein Cas1